MKTKIKIVKLLLVMAIAFPAIYIWATDGNHLAVIASVDGDGTKVKRFSQNDLETPAKMGMKLFDKDTVITGAASCALMFNTGDLVKVSPNSRLTVNMRPMDSKALTSISRKLAAAFFTEDPQEDSLSTIGGVRAVEKDMPVLMYPKESTIPIEKPTFKWSEIPGAKNYVVTLTDSEGSVWTKEAALATLAYPTEFPVLKKGEPYFWQVDVVLKDTRKSSETGTFDVIKDDLRAELNEIEAGLSKDVGDQSAHFMLASWYQKHNMMHDAIEQYQKLAEMNPTSAYPQEQLGTAYMKLGWKERAVEAFTKATQLDPNSLAAHTCLVKLYQATGEPEKAGVEQGIVDKIQAGGAK